MKAVCCSVSSLLLLCFLKNLGNKVSSHIGYNLWNFAAYKYNVTHVCVDPKFVVPEI